MLSRLGRRARVRDLVGSADGAAAAEVVELVRAGLCVLEEVPGPAVEDGPEPRPEQVDPPAEADAARPWPPTPESAGESAGESAVDPEPTADREPDGDGIEALPRRDPGRTLSPVAAVLQRRHAEIRRPGDEVFRGPDTDTLRRLLGSLQSPEDPAPPGPGGDR